MYQKGNWRDRVIQNPRTYNIQNNPDGTITLIESPGTITEAGTPVTASRMNNIENGIANVDLTLMNLKRKMRMGVRA